MSASQSTRASDDDGNEDDDEVVCPIAGCEYTGSPRSVESHISAKTDKNHKGEVGRQYRDQLRAPKPTSNERSDEVADEHVTNEVARDDSGERDDTSSTHSDTTEVAEEHVTGEVAAPDESDTSIDAAHAGVPAVVFVALLFALVLVVVYLTWPRRSERERDERSAGYARHPFV